MFRLFCRCCYCGNGCVDILVVIVGVVDVHIVFDHVVAVYHGAVVTVVDVLLF